MKFSSNLATLIESFFSDRLMKQLQASQNTVASYRDTFRLLLRYAQEQLGKQPSVLGLEDLDAPFIGAFLDYLEKERGNTARTRNARLAALHSFFRFVAYQEPAHSALIQRVLAMPSKRFEKALVEFLTRPEVDALLEAPDRKTWGGRRDHTLFLVDVDTGLRVSELVGLRCEDVVLGVGAHVRCQGKGRKERCTPLTRKAVDALRSWLQERDACPSDPLFPNARGGTLSRDGVEYILAKHLKVARQSCPSLNNKRVSPHVFRHTAAMDLLQSGVDRSVIALWLGHESVDTTQIYIDANLAMKEEALSKVAPRNVRPGRFRADDRLLAFLNSL